MKKILIVNTDLDIGGGELSLVSFLNNIDLEKYDVYLGLLQNKMGMIDRISPKIKIINLWEETLKEKFDAAIGYKQGKSTAYVANKIKADRKISVWRHGSIKYKGIRKYIYGNQYKKIDFIVTLNEDLKNKISSHFNIPFDKIKIIEDLFDKEEFIKKSNEFIIEKKSKYVFSTVARIVPVKKTEFIPQVAKKLIDNGINDFKWYVLGEAKDRRYYNKILEITKKLNVSDKIEFCGNVENPMPYLKISDIYIHPSSAESWCRSITEALALKIPVLSTNTIGGIAQIKSGINGYLCKIDKNDLFETLMKMIENIEEIKENQPEFIQDNKIVMEKYYSLF